ncbi:hypothetical protein D3C72_1656490 [compost metagenome]
MNRHKQIRAVLVGDLYAVIQRDKGIAAARQTRVNAVTAQNRAHVFGDRQHHMFLFRAVATNCAGVDSAVSRIEHHHPFCPGFFYLGLTVSIAGFQGAIVFSLCLCDAC